MKNKVLIVAVVILAAIILKLCIFSGYSENQVRKLIEKNQKYKNFSSTMTYNTKGVSMKSFYKQNNNLVTYTLDTDDLNVGIYMDLDKDEAILTILNYAMVTKISELDSEYSVDSIADTSKQILNYFGDYTYKYIDKQKYHNKNCVHFELKDEESKKSGDYYRAEYYIDTKTGLIERIIGYDKNEKEIIDIEIETELNAVKDGEITKPNLSGKQIIKK